MTQYFSNFVKIIIKHPTVKLNCTNTRRIIGDHWYGFRSNRLSADNILCIGQILKTEWEHSEMVHQVFIGFNNAFDSDSRDDLYNIHIVVVILAYLVILTKCV